METKIKEVYDNMIIHLNNPPQTIEMNRAELKAMANDLLDAIRENESLRKQYEDAIRMFNEADLERMNLRKEIAELFTKYENSSDSAEEYKRLYEETNAKLETAKAIRDDLEKVIDEAKSLDHAKIITMKFGDGFCPANADETCPDGYSVVADGRKFVAVLVSDDCNEIRTYDDEGGWATWPIPSKIVKNEKKGEL